MGGRTTTTYDQPLDRFFLTQTYEGAAHSGTGYPPWPGLLWAHLIIAPDAMPPAGLVGQFQVKPVPDALAEVFAAGTYPKVLSTMAGEGGFEPPTSQLYAKCSANLELPASFSDDVTFAYTRFFSFIVRFGAARRPCLPQIGRAHV